jgi:hypothetical protein
MDHIRAHAPRYYPTLTSEKLGVQLLSKQERPSAMLYRFKVGNEAQIRSVFVKVPLRLTGNGKNNGSIYEKPQLFPKTEPRDMHWLHYTALKTIYDYYTRLDREQLGAIRVLDYLPEYHAILPRNLAILNCVIFFLEKIAYAFRSVRLGSPLPFKM